MMDELLKELAPVVESETQRASEQYGDRYASAHEAESVLREEIEELAEESIQTQIKLTSLQKNLRENNMIDFQKHARLIYDNALNAAAEAIQVAAVCEKISRGFEK